MMARPPATAGSPSRPTRRRGLGRLSALLLLAAAGAVAQPTPEAAIPKPPTPADRRANRELVIALRTLPQNLNPLFARTPEADFINGFLRRPVTAFDPEWQLTCILCTELPTVENGKARIEADGSMTVTFELSPDARWGDGTPVTSQDVVFSWQALQTQPEALATRPWTQAVASIIAENEHTFTVRWKQPRHDYNRLNDFPILPEHVERLALRNMTAYLQSSRFAINPLDAGLGNGPYRLERQEADRVVLAPSPTWGGAQKPWFTRIVLLRLPDLAAVKTALAQGAVDLLPPGLSLRLDDVTTLENGPALPDSKVVYTAGTAFEQITFNLDNPILQDVRVRQALFHALNRAALNASGLEGRYQVARSFVSTADPAFAASAQPQDPFDPAEAGRLLDAAGWLRQADGVRMNAAGERLRFDFTTSVRQPARAMIQQVASNAWRNLGVEIVIDNVDQATLVGKVLPERAFNGVVLFSWRQEPQDLPWFAFHSTAVPNPAGTVRGINFAGLADPAMDAALAALAVTPQAAQQQALWRQLQHRYFETLPGLPLYFRPVGGVLPKALRGFPVYGHAAPASLWAEGWFLTGDSDASGSVTLPY